MAIPQVKNLFCINLTLRIKVPSMHRFEQALAFGYPGIRLAESIARMFNLLPLAVQITKSTNSNLFSFQCHSMSFFQPIGSLIQPLGTL